MSALVHATILIKVNVQKFKSVKKNNNYRTLNKYYAVSEFVKKPFEIDSFGYFTRVFKRIIYLYFNIKWF